MINLDLENKLTHMPHWELVSLQESYEDFEDLVEKYSTSARDLDHYLHVLIRLTDTVYTYSVDEVKERFRKALEEEDARYRASQSDVGSVDHDEITTETANA